MLQISCSFINEVITNKLTERIIKIYTIRIIHNYYVAEKHNEEYVFTDCKEKNKAL